MNCFQEKLWTDEQIEREDLTGPLCIAHVQQWLSNCQN